MRLVILLHRKDFYIILVVRILRRELRAEASGRITRDCGESLTPVAQVTQRNLLNRDSALFVLRFLFGMIVEYMVWDMFGIDLLFRMAYVDCERYKRVGLGLFVLVSPMRLNGVCNLVRSVGTYKGKELLKGSYWGKRLCLEKLFGIKE